MKTLCSRRTLLIGIVLLLINLSVSAQDSLNVTMMSRIYAHWASAEDVAVVGNYAYVASTGLRIVDVSDPARPEEVGYCLTPGYCYDVVVSGDYAYVACSYAGLFIIDITDPANPVETGFCDTPGQAHGVSVQLDYAYVSAYNQGMRIIDVSDPADPFEVGCFEHDNLEDDVVAFGDYAYIAGWGEGLRIVDISDPTDPVQVGICDTPGWALGVAVHGRFAYVADRDYGLRVIDILDPANPYEVGSYVPNLTFIDAFDVALQGDYAYLGVGGTSYTWNNGIRVVDITDPSNPDCVGSCETPYYALGVFASGPYAYVACQCHGLRLIQITDPENPVEVSYFYDDGYIYDVDVSGDYACITDEPAGLRVVDVSNPADPVETGVFDTPGEAWGIAVQDNFAYLADGNIGLTIVDFSDPANPVETGSCGGLGQVEAIAVQGDYAYALSQGMYVIDVSDPANPVRTGFYPETWFYELDIAVSGDFAYLAVCDGGLQIINISDPSNPTFMGSCNVGWLRGVAVAGNYAYVTDQNGLWAIDVSDPLNPVEAGYCDLVSCTYRVTVSGNYAYVSAEYGGLRVVDISDPANPAEAGYYDTPGGALGVTSSEGYIYLASGNNLGIYQFTPPDVSIGLTPFNPPIQVPAGGGAFDFNIEIANNGTISTTFDIWTMATLPDGSEYGPIIDVQDFRIDPGAALNRDRTQNVPANAPAGDYTYDAYAGIYPDIILDEGHFEFEKLTVSDGGTEVQNWQCRGEEFVPMDKPDEILNSQFSILNSQFSIINCSPNPFNPVTIISFTLPVAGMVKLNIFDVTGRSVGVQNFEPIKKWMTAGSHQVVFDGSDLASGVYFVRMEAGNKNSTLKILLIK